MKNILYILLLITTIAYSQKEKQSDKKIDIKTMAKNHVRKGNDLYNQGQFANAEKEYQKAVTLNPNYDKANYNYGNTQFLQNKTKEAKKQYDLVSKTTKDPFIKADASHNLGNIAMKEKKYAEAINAYKESLRNNPKDDETRYNLALAQKLLKEEQKKDKKKDDKKDDKDKKDKDKDKKDQEKDDKDKKDNKDKKDDKSKDDKDKKKDNKGNKDKDKKDEKEKDKQQKPKPKPSKLSPEQVKQLLEAMNKEENKTQKKINAKKARGRKIKQDKDW